MHPPRKGRGDLRRLLTCISPHQMFLRMLSTWGPSQPCWWPMQPVPSCTWAGCRGIRVEAGGVGRTSKITSLLPTPGLQLPPSCGAAVPGIYHLRGAWWVHNPAQQTGWKVGQGLETPSPETNLPPHWTYLPHPPQSSGNAWLGSSVPASCRNGAHQTVHTSIAWWGFNLGNFMPNTPPQKYYLCLHLMSVSGCPASFSSAWAFPVASPLFTGIHFSNKYLSSLCCIHTWN